MAEAQGAAHTLVLPRRLGVPHVFWDGESVYVVLELQDGDDPLPQPGARLQLQGMETQQPVLQLAEGSRLVGAFEETVGTQLVLSDAVSSDGSHRVELVAHTDKRITFHKAPAPKAEMQAAAGQQGAAGEQQAAAAAGAPP